MAQRRKPLQAIFVTADGKISIQHLLTQSPRQLVGLTRVWTRTAVDRKPVGRFGHGLSIFEETDLQPLTSLAVAYQSGTLANAIREARRATLCA